MKILTILICVLQQLMIFTKERKKIVDLSHLTPTLSTVKSSIVKRTSFTSPSSTTTAIPTTTCIDELNFAGGNRYGTNIGLCHTFAFPWSKKNVTACGYNFTKSSWLPVELNYKDVDPEIYPNEAGLGLSTGLKGIYEIGINGLVQFNVSSIFNSAKPQFMIGSTDNIEYYCIYGSQEAGVLGTTLLFMSAFEGTYYDFPVGFNNYKYMSFTACASNLNPLADVLIMKFRINNGASCTSLPTTYPTSSPTTKPSFVPTNVPTIMPSCKPSKIPSFAPSSQPSIPKPTSFPSLMPSVKPTFIPSQIPSLQPTRSHAPTFVPSSSPSAPTVSPSLAPSTPTYIPSSVPSFKRSFTPSAPTSVPTNAPTMNQYYCPFYSVSSTDSARQNTVNCDISACAGQIIFIKACNGYLSSSCLADQYIRLRDGPDYTTDVAANDDGKTCGSCSEITYTVPSGTGCHNYQLLQGCYEATLCSGQFVIEIRSPTKSPSIKPSLAPTQKPTLVPTSPTCIPTLNPSIVPTFNPSCKPSRAPSIMPTRSLKYKPTKLPTFTPSFKPSISFSPSCVPTVSPTAQPSYSQGPSSPTVTPSVTPSKPTVSPSIAPFCPSVLPSFVPSETPTYRPSITPTKKSIKPTLTPTSNPTITLSPTVSCPAPYYSYGVSLRPSDPSTYTISYAYFLIVHNYTNLYSFAVNPETSFLVSSINCMMLTSKYANPPDSYLLEVYKQPVSLGNNITQVWYRVYFEWVILNSQLSSHTSKLLSQQQNILDSSVVNHRKLLHLPEGFRFSDIVSTDPRILDPFYSFIKPINESVTSHDFFTRLVNYYAANMNGNSNVPKVYTSSSLPYYIGPFGPYVPPPDVLIAPTLSPINKAGASQFSGTDQMSKTAKTIIVPVILVALLCCCAILAFLLWKRWKRKKEEGDKFMLAWIDSPSDIKVFKKDFRKNNAIYAKFLKEQEDKEAALSCTGSNPSNYQAMTSNDTKLIPQDKNNSQPRIHDIYKYGTNSTGKRISGEKNKYNWDNSFEAGYADQKKCDYDYLSGMMVTESHKNKSNDDLGDVIITPLPRRGQKILQFFKYPVVIKAPVESKKDNK